MRNFGLWVLFCAVSFSLEAQTASSVSINVNSGTRLVNNPPVFFPMDEFRIDSKWGPSLGLSGNLMGNTTNLTFQDQVGFITQQLNLSGEGLFYRMSTNP